MEEKELTVSCLLDYFFDSKKEPKRVRAIISVKAGKIFVDGREVKKAFNPDHLKFIPVQGKKGEKYFANGSLEDDYPPMIPMRLEKILSLFLEEMH